MFYFILIYDFVESASVSVRPSVCQSGKAYKFFYNKIDLLVLILHVYSHRAFVIKSPYK